MTSYFDQAHTDLREARAFTDVWKRLSRFEEIEQKVVFDCTVAAMCPGFPGDLRLAVHQVVLQHGIATLPSTAPPADFETDEEHARRLDDLVGDLHSVFHRVAQCAVDGFSDQPPMPIRRLYALGQEEREKLVAGETLPERADPLTEALAEVSRARWAVAVAEGRVKRAFVAGATWRTEKGDSVLREFEAVDAAEDLYPYGLDDKPGPVDEIGLEDTLWDAVQVVLKDSMGYATLALWSFREAPMSIRIAVAVGDKPCADLEAFVLQVRARKET